MTKGINENVDQNTAKYHIYATFTINGVVEVQDVIGALFGQTEGLLNDLDLRELQKSGRIGRIVVNAHSENGITSGEIIIPSSLDRTETAILAATLETVDRVGPCNASLRLKEIRDLRASKLKAIEERAKELLKDWSQGANDKEDLAEKIQGELEKAQVIMWNGLPAGPDIDKSEHVIIVEGRNDVQQLFKIGVKNTIAVNGTSIPKVIIDLTQQRECVAFVDGDRGGEMILNELIQVSNVKFFARAPPNREVEELSPKELVKCLQQRLPIEEYIKQRKAQEEKDHQEREVKDRSRQDRSQQGREVQGRDQKGQREPRRNERGPPGQKPGERGPPGTRGGPQNRPGRGGPREGGNKRDSKGGYRDREPRQRPEIHIPKELIPQVKSLISTNEAIALDESNQEIFRTANTQIFDQLANQYHTVIMDGVVSQRFLDKAIENGIKRVIAVNAMPNLKVPDKSQIELFFFKDFL